MQSPVFNNISGLEDHTVLEMKNGLIFEPNAQYVRVNAQYPQSILQGNRTYCS